MTATYVDFLTAVKDITAGNPKIKKSDVFVDGSLPVVDQGKDLIAGFVSNPQFAVKKKSAVIVFGDHTRNFKYLDFDFAIGADGTKVLEPQQGFLPKYLYHYFESITLPDWGYSRHFKALKVVPVPKPPLDEQRRIAAILDQADAVSAKRQQQLNKLDFLLQSVFSNMFKSACYPLVPASSLFHNFRNGISPSTNGQVIFRVLTLSAITRGEFDRSAIKMGTFEAVPPKEKTVNRSDFLICRGNGNKSLVGVGVFSPYDSRDTAFPDTMIAGDVNDQKINRSYLEVAWKQKDVRNQLEAVARTTNGTYKINQKSLAGITISLPPLELQESFSSKTEKIRQSQERMTAALERDNELFASLQSRAFRGEL